MRAATNEVFPRGYAVGTGVKLGGSGQWGDLEHGREVLERQLACARFFNAGGT
jgi:hypothetical protein